MKTLSPTLFKAPPQSGFGSRARCSPPFPQPMPNERNDADGPQCACGTGPQYPAVGVATPRSAAVLDGCHGGKQTGAASTSTLARLGLRPLPGHGTWAVPTAVIQERRTSSRSRQSPMRARPWWRRPNRSNWWGPVEQVEAVTPPPTVRTYITEKPGRPPSM